MQEFRSHLLRKMPVTRHPGRYQRIVTRLSVLAVLAIILLIVILIMAFQLLPPRGLGLQLYQYHDKIFLPIKGYTYTLFFPVSIIWWGIALTLLVLAVASFVSDRSFIREPHVQFTRWLLRRTVLHPFLLKGGLFFQRLGLFPYVVYNAVLYERDLQLQLIYASWDQIPHGEAAQPRAGLSRVEPVLTKKIFQNLVDLTNLLIELELLHPGGHALKAAAYWQQTFLLVSLKNKRPRQNKAPLENLARQLSQSAPRSYNEPEASFTHQAVVRDLAWLMQGNDREIAKEMLSCLYTNTTQEMGQLDRVKAQKYLVQEIEARRLTLEQLRQTAERQFMPAKKTHRTNRTLEAIADDTGQAALLGIGKMTTYTALQVAFQTGVSEIGLAYLEALEAARFALLCLKNRSDLLSEKQWRAWSEILADQPTYEQYWLFAMIAKSATNQKLTTAQALINYQPFLRQNDFDLNLLQTDLLTQGAGPLTPDPMHLIDSRDQ